MKDVPLVLGTAGHVDHGKTALVLALTGRDTDRLPEEKARGISIALGFAPLELPSGRRVSLVDVPGHERFVRHMVAGASGVDGYLLCVAADDGVMPQTVEHIAVLRLLGVNDGVVAVTKCDLADPARTIAEVRELVGASPEVVAVSVVTNAGIPQLRGALERLAERTRRRTNAGRPRLFVDRTFSVAGAGTVVTGTLWGDAIDAGDRVTIIPGERTGRVRGVQVHDETVARADGGRVALNLGGIDRDEAPRGSCVVRTADGWRPTSMLDVAVDWLADSGTSLRTRRRLQAFLGTTEVSATCVLLEGDEIPPGGRAYAQLRLDAEVAADAGDRLVLRSAERRTVGGATVIDPAPARHGRGAGAAARLALVERRDPDALLRLRSPRRAPPVRSSPGPSGPRSKAPAGCSCGTTSPSTGRSSTRRAPGCWRRCSRTALRLPTRTAPAAWAPSRRRRWSTPWRERVESSATGPASRSRATVPGARSPTRWTGSWRTPACVPPARRSSVSASASTGRTSTPRCGSCATRAPSSAPATCGSRPPPRHPRGGGRPRRSRAARCPSASSATCGAWGAGTPSRLRRTSTPAASLGASATSACCGAEQ